MSTSRSMLSNLTSHQDGKRRQAVDYNSNTALNRRPETQPCDVDKLLNILEVFARLVEQEGAQEGDDDCGNAGGEGKPDAELLHAVDLEVPNEGDWNGHDCMTLLAGFSEGLECM